MGAQWGRGRSPSLLVAESCQETLYPALRQGPFSHIHLHLKNPDFRFFFTLSPFTGSEGGTWVGDSWAEGNRFPRNHGFFMTRYAALFPGGKSLGVFCVERNLLAVPLPKARFID